MIRNRDILEILESHMPTGKWMAVEKILSIVERAWELSAEDWALNPGEVRRNSNYPRWKRKVQAALHTLKEKKKIKHIKDTHEYMFDSSSFC